MADERDALALRTQIGQYWIHDVEHFGADMIVYRAEDMRLNREVWLHEYFPQGMAKRHRKEEGPGTVYVHPTQSEAFAEGKALQQRLYDALKAVEHPSLPAIAQTFESGGTFYAATQYRGAAKKLQQFHNTGKSLSEQQVGIFALSLVTLSLTLQRYQLSLHSINAETVLIEGITKAPVVAYAEFIPAQAENTAHLIHELGYLLHHMVGGGEAQEGLEPLQPDELYSAALCGLINRMVSEEPSKRPKTFEELQTLLQGYRPSEAQCEPLVCEKTDNPLSAVARVASLVVIFVFAYYIFTKQQPSDVKELSWFDAVGIGVMAYFEDPNAQSTLGQMYEAGYVVQRDAQEALQWYTKAASQGNLYAQMSLGHFYREGIGVTRNDEQAAFWFRKAAEQGNADAQYNMGYFYASGVGVQRNRKEAEKWLHMAASQDSEEAQKLLSQLSLYDNMPTSHDYAKTHLKQLLAAAEAGKTYAQYDLSIMYFYGKSVEQDYHQAFVWAQRAANAHYHDAYYVLGYLYFNGYGIEQNYKEALRWYEKSANAGNYTASHSALGYMYYYGLGVPVNYTIAMQWYHKAAEQGSGKAEYALGLMFELGRGTAANPYEALSWYKKAALHRDPNAASKIKSLTERMEREHITAPKRSVVAKSGELPKSYGRYIDYGKYVKDTKTGLLWQKDGRESGRRNFYQAAEYAKNLNLGGIDGWRVPSAKELATIFPATVKPFTGVIYVPENQGKRYSYWTNELGSHYEDEAILYHWYAKGGRNNCYGSRNYVLVRCVHDPL